MLFITRWRFCRSLINAGLISPDNVNLSTQDFLKFYATDNVQKKDNALMYMLGWRMRQKVKPGVDMVRLTV